MYIVRVDMTNGDICYVGANGLTYSKAEATRYAMSVAASVADDSDYDGVAVVESATADLPRLCIHENGAVCAVCGVRARVG